MTVEEPKRRRPSKRWVGKRLRALRDMTVPVMSGAEARIAEVLDGQELEVVEVQADGWLKCKLRQDMFFRDGQKKKVHSKDLIVGVHLEHDIDKFHVRRKRLREAKVPLESEVVAQITVAAQGWLETQRVLDQLSTDLARLAGSSPEMDQRLRAIVPEIAEQKDRVRRVLLAFRQRCATYGVPDWWESAIDLLNSIRLDFMQKGMRLHAEMGEYRRRDFSEARTGKLVQTFSWIASFVKRIWSWLRKTEKKIAELEGLVFYS